MSVPRVYFFCSNEEGNLQEDVIALAEGLRELRIPFSGNCNYWLETPSPDSYLIREDSQIAPDDCDLVVVSYTFPYWIRMKTFDLRRRPLPPGLFREGRRYRTVYMDSHDSYRTVSWEPEFRQFDVILRSKMNRRLWHPENMRPWVLGLNRRVIEATADSAPFATRRRAILVNFGASHPYPHGVRDIASRRFEPLIAEHLAIDRTKDDLSAEPADRYESLMWRQTGGRFSRSYYERLKATQAVACFCGELIPPAPFRNAERYLVGGNRAKLRRALYEALALADPRPRRSVQWDSFRFWEALAAGCATFNIDLDRYGVHLPVMPTNGVHYLGVDLANARRVLDHVDETTLSGIAESGRTWAMANYSPRALAGRLLESVGLSSGRAAA